MFVGEPLAPSAPTSLRLDTPRESERERMLFQAPPAHAPSAEKGDAPRLIIAGRHGHTSRSQPISRVLLRRAPCEARYDRHSSWRHVTVTLEPPTRGLCEQRRRPLTWCCSGWRLPRFTRILLRGCDSSLWPCSSPSLTACAKELIAAGRYPASCSSEPGLSSIGKRTLVRPPATVWLTSSKHFNTPAGSAFP